MISGVAIVSALYVLPWHLFEQYTEDCLSFDGMKVFYGSFLLSFVCSWCLMHPVQHPEEIDTGAVYCTWCFLSELYPLLGDEYCPAT